MLWFKRNKIKNGKRKPEHALGEKYVAVMRGGDQNVENENVEHTKMSSTKMSSIPKCRGPGDAR